MRHTRKSFIHKGEVEVEKVEEVEEEPVEATEGSSGAIGCERRSVNSIGSMGTRLGSMDDDGFLVARVVVIP